MGALPLTQDSGFEELKKRWERIVEEPGSQAGEDLEHDFCSHTGKSLFVHKIIPFNPSITL